MGVLDIVTLVGSLVLALPIGMLGVEFLVGGRYVAGIGFLAVAVGLVAGQHYLGTPSIKKYLAGRVLDSVATDDKADQPEEPAGGEER